MPDSCDLYSRIDSDRRGTPVLWPSSTKRDTSVVAWKQREGMRWEGGPTSFNWTPPGCFRLSAVPPQQGIHPPPAEPPENYVKPVARDGAMWLLDGESLARILINRSPDSRTRRPFLGSGQFRFFFTLNIFASLFINVASIGTDVYHVLHSSGSKMNFLSAF